MCLALVTPNANLRSISDLRKAGLRIKDSDVPEGETENNCMCNVDLEAILARNGLAISSYDVCGDPVISSRSWERMLAANGRL